MINGGWEYLQVLDNAAATGLEVTRADRTPLHKFEIAKLLFNCGAQFFMPVYVNTKKNCLEESALCSRKRGHNKRLDVAQISQEIPE